MSGSEKITASFKKGLLMLFIEALHSYSYKLLSSLFSGFGVEGRRPVRAGLHIVLARDFTGPFVSNPQCRSRPQGSGLFWLQGFVLVALG